MEAAMDVYTEIIDGVNYKFSYNATNEELVIYKLFAPNKKPLKLKTVKSIPRNVLLYALSRIGLLPQHEVTETEDKKQPVMFPKEQPVSQFLFRIFYMKYKQMLTKEYHEAEVTNNFVKKLGERCYKVQQYRIAPNKKLKNPKEKIYNLELQRR